MKTALVTGACINTGVAIVEKFASEGWNVVFTGRSDQKVKAAERSYREKFPEVRILGFAIDSLKEDGSVDEAAVKELFAALDREGIFVETLVLNAADQGKTAVNGVVLLDHIELLQCNILPQRRFVGIRTVPLVHISMGAHKGSGGSINIKQTGQVL